MFVQKLKKFGRSRGRRTDAQANTNHILVLIVEGLLQCRVCTLLSLKWPLMQWTLCQNIQDEGGVDSVGQ